MKATALAGVIVAGLVGCTPNVVPAPSPGKPASVLSIVPYAEYHAHLVSPTSAPMLYEPVLPPVDIPADLSAILHTLEKGWNDTTIIAGLLGDDAILYNSGNQDLSTWVLGRLPGARYLSQRFARAYRVTPVSYHLNGRSAQVAGYLSRGEGAATRHFGHVLIALDKNSSDVWKISALTPIFPGPSVGESVTAEKVVAQLDDAGIKRAAVLSVAYWYGSPFGRRVDDEYAKVRAENDWVASEVARYPTRLVGFCSFNPLKNYALEELERCSRNPSFRGIKLHFGNSGVELTHPEDAQRVARVFRAANEHRLAIVAHMWTSPEYEETGGNDARVFLATLLPEAPDVTVQIAHMAGGGRATDSALAVFAGAIAAHDPRTNNLYFDVATLTAGETREGLQRDAMRMRQIGLNRILFGSDLSPPNPSPRESWEMFRLRVPLTDDEFRIVAGNEAPYLR
jgi:predicted TIM-barrel fold metal-dependent hydrolase